MILAPTIIPNLKATALGAILLFATAGSAVAQYTEITGTVAPGRFRLEMDALSLVIDREGTESFTAFGAGSFLVTTGLTKNWDLQLGAEILITQRYESGSFTDRNTGIGDVYVRSKWRFFESDSLSAAVIPFAKIPTNTGGVGNDSLEGGVIVPWEAYLLGFFTLNAQVEADFVRNQNDDGYGVLWYGSAALSREVTKRLSLYAEIDAAKTSGSNPWQTTVGFGAYLQISDFLSWDVAVYRGISRAAPDWNPVVRLNLDF